MPDLKSVPDEVKWRLAAQLAALLPALYDRAYRDVVGGKYDEIEQEIWMELSRMALDIVRDLSLPTGDAAELSESLRMVMGILFGPDYKSETLEISLGVQLCLSNDARYRPAVLSVEQETPLPSTSAWR